MYHRVPYGCAHATLGEIKRLSHGQPGGDSEDIVGSAMLYGHSAYLPVWHPAFRNSAPETGALHGEPLRIEPELCGGAPTPLERTGLYRHEAIKSWGVLAPAPLGWLLLGWLLLG